MSNISNKERLKFYHLSQWLLGFYGILILAYLYQRKVDDSKQEMVAVYNMQIVIEAPQSIPDIDASSVGM